MINIKRSYPAPNSLGEEKIKKSGSYNKEDIINTLEKDFHRKCYICETPSTSSQVEHLKSHRVDLDLKFDWDNLFLSCAHCNNIKSDKYDEILDCTKENVEEKIRYYIFPVKKSTVFLYNVDKDYNTYNKTEKTIELLDKCYNSTTVLKKLDSYNIRNQIVEEVKKFLYFIDEYFEAEENEDLEEMKNFEKQIKRKLSKKSPYTSFKRWIIKDNKSLYEIFGKYLND